MSVLESSVPKQLKMSVALAVGLYRMTSVRSPSAEFCMTSAGYIFHAMDDRGTDREKVHSVQYRWRRPPPGELLSGIWGQTGWWSGVATGPVPCTSDGGEAVRGSADGTTHSGDYVRSRTDRETVTASRGTIPLPPYDGIVLPPPPPVDVRYPVTTDYYWGAIDQNTSVAPAGGSFVTGNGPFGFKSSVKLPGTSCMRHNNFMREGDSCVHNPATCSSGLSFSLWHRCAFDTDAFTPRDGLPYRYLVSTGGDDQGSPGVAIYLQGMVLGAIVSTGEQYWKVETIGLLPNNTWNNIGVRWRAPYMNTTEPEFVGLQLYINQRAAAMVIHAMEPVNITEAQPPLDPPELMVGCHKTAADDEYRHYCPCEFDEIAMWKRALRTNETMFFIGGLEEDFAGMSAQVFAELLREVDLTDPNQQKVAVSIASKIVDEPESATIKNPLRPSNGEEEGEEGEEEEQEEEDVEASLLLATRGQISKMHVLADLMFTMTAPEAVKANQTEDELESFMNLVGLGSQLLQTKYRNKWKGIEVDNDNKKPDPKDPTKIDRDGEAADMVDRMELFALSSVSGLIPPEVNGTQQDVFVRKQTPNVDMYIEQRSVWSLRQEQMAPLPSDHPRHLDSIQMPTVVFRKSGCEEARIGTVFSKYDNYGDVAPHRFLRKEFKTRDSQYLGVDGAVLSLRIVATLDQVPTDECLPTIDDLRRSPIRTAHRHRQPGPALRGPLFHEDEIVSEVLRRHCVWWNIEGAGGRGEWDATGCVVLETNDFFTKCACKVIGQYAVVAEKVEPKIVDISSPWLVQMRGFLRAFSMILLFLYAFVVWRNDCLWEMFHQLRMACALLLLVGNIVMIESERPAVRADRHSCTTVAALMQLLYLAAGALVASEGYACFRALAYGVVGGRLASYFSLSFGVSLLSLGYALGLEIHRYGDDPQCMMGWEMDVKLIFFAPMSLCLLLSLTSACLILCNMSTPRLRKQIMAIDHASMCAGYVFFAPYFVATWTAGVLAYMRLEALDHLPSFYPLFQMLNAGTGIVFFICQGLLSRRFLAMLLCRRRERQQLLLAYARHEDEPDPVDQAPAVSAPAPSSAEEELSSSSEESGDEDGTERDPEAAVGPAAAVVTPSDQPAEGPGTEDQPTAAAPSDQPAADQEIEDQPAEEPSPPPQESPSPPPQEDAGDAAADAEPEVTGDEVPPPAAYTAPPPPPETKTAQDGEKADGAADNSAEPAADKPE